MENIGISYKNNHLNKFLCDLHISSVNIQSQHVEIRPPIQAVHKEDKLHEHLLEQILTEARHADLLHRL